jgi:hypothetical protein
LRLELLLLVELLLVEFLLLPLLLLLELAKVHLLLEPLEPLQTAAGTSLGPRLALLRPSRKATDEQRVALRLAACGPRSRHGRLGVQRD